MWFAESQSSTLDFVSWFVPLPFQGRLCPPAGLTHRQMQESLSTSLGDWSLQQYTEKKVIEMYRDYIQMSPPTQCWFGDEHKLSTWNRKASVKTPNDRLIEDPTESWSQIDGYTILSPNHYIIRNNIRLFPSIPKTFGTRYRASFLILAKRSQYLEITSLRSRIVYACVLEARGESWQGYAPSRISWRTRTAGKVALERCRDMWKNIFSGERCFSVCQHVHKNDQTFICSDLLFYQINK